MKHELRAILKMFDTVPTGPENPDFTKAFSALSVFCESLPEGNIVSTADFKYAKMQTVHQLLVKTVSLSVVNDECAVELARLVDAAYGAIDSQAETAKASPVDDIDLNAADFSDALMWLKEGRKVARQGWGVEGMFLWLVPAGVYPARMEAIKGHYVGDMVPYGGYIAMKTADGIVVPWLASQTDMLADDWLTVS